MTQNCLGCPTATRDGNFIVCKDGFTTTVGITIELAKKTRICGSCKREEKEMKKKEYKQRLKNRMIGTKKEKKKRWEK